LVTLESFTLRLRQSRPVRLKERLCGGQRKTRGPGETRCVFPDRPGLEPARWVRPL